MEYLVVLGQKVQIFYLALTVSLWLKSKSLYFVIRRYKY
jgi:hypothetical protein